MEEKNKRTAGIFYWTMTTLSLMFMWKSIMLLNDRVSTVEKNMDELAENHNMNMKRINKNFVAHNNKINKILGMLKED